MRGKAPTGFCGSTGRKDHPRMCGEKPERLLGAGDRSWITPACAGKSWSNALPCSRREDHPRVCGEKFFVIYPATYRYGITPACAGKRSVDGNARLSEQDHPRMCGEKREFSEKCSCFQDHPRMCGEKLCRSVALPLSTGSPPHVRGKVGTLISDKTVQRITPACAGKRESPEMHEYSGQDHPRMCGEKTKKIP